MVGTRPERLELFSQLVPCFVTALDAFAVLALVAVIGTEPFGNSCWRLAGCVEEVVVLLEEIYDGVCASVFVPFALGDECFGCRGWRHDEPAACGYGCGRSVSVSVASEVAVEAGPISGDLFERAIRMVVRWVRKAHINAAKVVQCITALVGLVSNKPLFQVSSKIAAVTTSCALRKRGRRARSAGQRVRMNAD